MHKENSWVNIKTQVITGVNKAPGSPRAWLNRALDIVGAETSQGVIRANRISVAAVWMRPCVTMPLPYNSLVRYFDYQLNQRNNKWVPKPDPTPAIGIAWEVPFDEIFQVLKLLNMSGAYMVWWAPPTPDKEKEKTLTELGMRSRLDHAEIYRMFEAGRTVREVADAHSCMTATVRYIYHKWKNNKPSTHKIARELNIVRA